MFVPLKQIHPKPGIPLKKIYVLLLRDYNVKTHGKIAILFLLQKLKFLPLGLISDPIIQYVPRAVSLGVRRLVLVPENLPPSDTKGKNEWRYSSSTRVTLMASTGICLYRN